MSHGTVSSFYLVNADSNEIVRDLTDGDIIVLAQDGINLNVCVRIDGAANSVTMGVGSTTYPVHDFAPWCLAADDASRGTFEAVPELQIPGRYTLSATPGLWTDIFGGRGETARITVIVVEELADTTIAIGELPTSAPTPKAFNFIPPTASLTLAPTSAPTKSPTIISPTASLTLAPTSAPTKSPTTQPTDLPTYEPTKQPTVQPTRRATLQPTRTATLQPAKEPTKEPTQQPTVPEVQEQPQQPTPSPTPNPTAQVSTQPSHAVQQVAPPFSIPNPSGSSTPAPTRLDTLLVQESEATLDLWLQSTPGVMEQRAEFDFQSATAAHVEQYLQKQQAFPYLAVRANLLKQESVVFQTRRRLRFLQQQQDPSPLKVQVYILSEYRSNITQPSSVQNWMETAWDTEEQRNSFVDRLQQSRSGAEFFANVKSVQILQDGMSPGAIQGSDDGGGGDGGSILLLVLIVAAAVAAVLGGIFVLRKRRHARKGAPADAGAAMRTDGSSNIDSSNISSSKLQGCEFVTATPSSTGNNNNDNATPYVDEVVVERQDDISTIGEPIVQGGNMPQTRGSGLDRDERTASVSGASHQDYDYTKAYLDYGGGRSLISEPEEESITRLSHGGFGAGSSAMSSVPASVAQMMMMKNGLLGPAPGRMFADDDDASFEQQFHQTDYANEERFDVVAPAGKLGMVIDTAEPEAAGQQPIPIVHAIKPNSVMEHQVRVGDRLLSLDGQDVTSMNLVEVANLIASKSGQERIFSFARDAIKQ